MTEWIEELRAECERTSQAAAGRRIGYSASTVNQVLKGTYGGDLESVKQAVLGALMGQTVECPVIGEIPRHRCIEHQRRASRPAATNPMRVQLAQACPVCTHGRHVKENS